MRRVIVLAEAAEDLDEARRFYDAREAGVGDYCVTSLVSIRRQCELIWISRSGFYYEPLPESDENLSRQPVHL